MEFSRHQHQFRRRHRPNIPAPKARDFTQPGDTGSESSYLRSLMDSHATVTVVLKTGERFQGHIRYYDRHCFSLGLSAHGPRLFLRKASVSYIAEE